MAFTMWYVVAVLTFIFLAASAGWLARKRGEREKGEGEGSGQGGDAMSRSDQAAAGMEENEAVMNEV